jgi:hypothetical protein
MLYLSKGAPGVAYLPTPVCMIPNPASISMHRQLTCSALHLTCTTQLQTVLPSPAFAPPAACHLVNTSHPARVCEGDKQTFKHDLATQWWQRLNLGTASCCTSVPSDH